MHGRKHKSKRRIYLEMANCILHFAICHLLNDQANMLYRSRSKMEQLHTQHRHDSFSVFGLDLLELTAYLKTIPAPMGVP